MMETFVDYRLTPEENLTVNIAAVRLDSIVDRRIAELSLREDAIIVLQLLVDMVDLSIGEDSLKNVEAMIAAHFGELRAKQVKKDLAEIFKELLETFGDLEPTIVRVALLRKLQKAIAAAPPGVGKVENGNGFVRRAKL